MNSIEAGLLIDWYNKNKRALPWRLNRDPYRIWISETMLQQTTTTAVLGYYDLFLKKFPSLLDLAQAPLTEVFERWAGLGYYSRAKNLHKASQELIALGGFPKTAAELQELPGFGPYTSRAVSSLAFSESVGVLDGNVIRVFSRKKNQAWEWWQGPTRKKIQTLADEWVKFAPSEVWNQALMELGSQICIPKNPKCTMCPWLNHCASKKKKNTALRPLKKPQKALEYWIWSPHVKIKKDKIEIVRNDYAPFFKNSWFLPGTIRKSQKPPPSFSLRHRITHHDIYVQGLRNPPFLVHKKSDRSPERMWVKIKELSRYVPSSLIKKVLQYEYAHK